MVKSLQQHLNGQLKKYPELSKSEDNKLWCGLCAVHLEVSIKGKWDSKHGSATVKNHCEGKNHQEFLKANKPKASSIKDAFEKASKGFESDQDFSKFLTKRMICCNIPLSKADLTAFKEIFARFNQKVPHSTTLRNNTNDVYIAIIHKIREAIGESKIYFIVETTDRNGRKVCNVLVGKLNGQYSKPMLLNVAFLSQVNNETIGQTILDSCILLWNGKIYYDKLILIISDQASYMLLAVKNLKNHFSNLNHITCLSHALHRVCEKIRSDNEDVNKLISKVKSILLKSKERQIQFVQSTGCSLPPQVILTRWGSWISAAFYYHENFDKIRMFIENLRGKSNAILSAKEVMQNIDIQNHLMEIKKYEFIPLAIEKLEKQGLKAQEQIDIVEDVKSKLSGNPLNKLLSSLAKNPDYNSFRNSNKSFEHQFITMYAPYVSVDVERSFSMYRDILTDKRTNLSDDNIEKYNIVYYNSFLNEN